MYFNFEIKTELDDFLIFLSEAAFIFNVLDYLMSFLIADAMRMSVEKEAGRAYHLEMVVYIKVLLSMR